MRSVPLKALKKSLSRYMRLVASGETVFITDRDRVVAELVPPRATTHTSGTDSGLAGTVYEELITPALLGPGLPPEPIPVAPMAELIVELEEDRSDR